MSEIVGLFALDPIPANEYITVYAGEVVNLNCPLIIFLNEMNDSLGRSYGFTIDNGTEVDAVNTGNLMRFANHADASLCNCMPKIVFSKGTYHAVLVAKRDIAANEELFFDYYIRNKELVWLNEYKSKFVLSDKKSTKKSGAMVL